MTYPDDAMTPLAREKHNLSGSTKGVWRVDGASAPPTPSPHKAKGTYSVHFARQSGTLTTM